MEFSSGVLAELVGKRNWVNWGEGWDWCLLKSTYTWHRCRWRHANMYAYLFTAVAYGMMANLDLGTESMRWMVSNVA